MIRAFTICFYICYSAKINFDNNQASSFTCVSFYIKLVTTILCKTLMSNQGNVSDSSYERGALTKSRTLIEYLTFLLNITMKMKDRNQFLSACFHRDRKVNTFSAACLYLQTYE